MQEFEGITGMVSVVIPTYRQGALLNRAVQSVIDQSHTNLEILVIDDASGSEFLDQLKIDDARLTVVELQENSGSPSTPRNLGITLSRGEWIAFLDSDDSWEPKKLELQLQFAERNSAFCVASNANRASGEFSIGMENPYFESLPSIVSANSLIRTNYIITSTVLVKRTLMIECMAFPDRRENTYEDMAVWLRIASLAQIHLQDELLANYLDQPSNSFRSQYANHSLMLSNTVKNLEEWLDNGGSSLSLRTKIVLHVALARSRILECLSFIRKCA